MAFDLRSLAILENQFIQLAAAVISGVVLLIFYLGGFSTLAPYIQWIWLIFVGALCLVALSVIGWIVRQ